ncbi:helix-turn-helix domain-containing protein [Chryseobacterium herbae]|uniref:Helix-turn-helix domain-containing protein n=1 Tax=Chryseobacterium herbae TaxID=2976476 RepID=A0ABT2IP30_9FLAO|nr:helix-turn-helix domain-containing protein [Chryseobacterium sp. pc1-10]MCT2560522.1 helix-turn-helix domain-containing protein [Chryseobacterium sp. pc1-10]
MEQVTKDDLRKLSIQLLHDLERIINKKITTENGKEPQEWLRSKSVRRIMDISPATLQNIRIAGKIRFRKVMGSYYYSRTDLLKLFGDDNK